MLTVDYDRLDLQPGMTVLDLGCGEGRHAFEALRRGAKVVAVVKLREWAFVFIAMVNIPASATSPTTVTSIAMMDSMSVSPFSP